MGILRVLTKHKRDSLVVLPFGDVLSPRRRYGRWLRTRAVALSNRHIHRHNDGERQVVLLGAAGIHALAKHFCPREFGNHGLPAGSVLGGVRATAARLLLV